MAFVLIERSEGGRGFVCVPERLVTSIAYCGDNGMNFTIVEYVDEDGEPTEVTVDGKPYFIGLGE